jgi:hypothetical protein
MSKYILQAIAAVAIGAVAERGKPYRERRCVQDSDVRIETLRYLLVDDILHYQHVHVGRVPDETFHGVWTPRALHQLQKKLIIINKKSKNPN